MKRKIKCEGFGGVISCLVGSDEEDVIFDIVTMCKGLSDRHNAKTGSFLSRGYKIPVPSVMVIKLRTVAHNVNIANHETTKTKLRITVI